jgi:hypothetical protein
MTLLWWIVGIAVAVGIIMWLISRWVAKGSKTPSVPDEMLSPYDEKKSTFHDSDVP